MATLCGDYLLGERRGSRKLHPAISQERMILQMAGCGYSGGAAAG